MDSSPEKVKGVPCEVAAVRRLERNWFSVVTEMNQSLGMPPASALLTWGWDPYRVGVESGTARELGKSRAALAPIRVSLSETRLHGQNPAVAWVYDFPTCLIEPLRGACD